MRGIAAVVAVVVVGSVCSASLADPKPRPKPPAKAAKPKDDPQPAKGFWNVLVKKGAKWKLKETIGDTPRTLAIETYDVRKIGTAEVARLRWTLIDHDGKKTDVGDTESGRYTQLAVTPDGLYILYAQQDDARVAQVLKGKPSRSDPPKAYEGTKQNHGRYLMVKSDDEVCLGQGPTPGAGDCPDTCDGTLCISATNGPIELLGNWAPGVSVFEASD